MREFCNYHNSNMSHLFREVENLRDRLPRLISEEKVETENKIRKILKQISKDKQYQLLKENESKAEAKFNDYIISNLSLEDKMLCGFDPNIDCWRHLFSEDELEEYNKKNKENELRWILLTISAIVAIIVSIVGLLNVLAPM